MAVTDYAEQARRFFEQARAEFEQGDDRQAAEKSWARRGVSDTIAIAAYMTSSIPSFVRPEIMSFAAILLRRQTSTSTSTRVIWTTTASHLASMTSGRLVERLAGFTNGA